MLAGIHFQYITDNGEMMEKVLSSGKPFLAFIVPVLLDKNLKTQDGKEILGRVYPEENYYPEWFRDTLKQNRKNSNLIFVQEGYTHYCERCFEKFLENGGREKDAWPDPFHEHVCLDGHAQSLEEQAKSMEQGRELMDKILYFTSEMRRHPEIYCPPNHLWNQNTLDAAAKKAFRYVVTKYLIHLPAYYEYNYFRPFIVLPESKSGERKNSPVISTYYDHLVEGKWEEFQNVLNNSDFASTHVSEKPMFLPALNQTLIKYFKQARDWKKRLRI